MQMKSSKMGQWPPSPSVEDEHTALAHEHSIDASIELLKSEDQPAPSRGSVDQYPIIIDSPDLRKPEEVNSQRQSNSERVSSDTCSSDDGLGPPTPPPVTRDQLKRFKQADSEYHGEIHDVSPDLEKQTSTRSRPQVSRIHTDMGGDIRAMATGSRRPPSPYSYTRTPTYHGSSSGNATAANALLSPAQPVVSSTPLDQQGRPSPFIVRRSSERDTSSPSIKLSATGPAQTNGGKEPNAYPAGGDLGNNRTYHLQPEIRTPQSATYRDVRQSFQDTRATSGSEGLQPGPSQSRRQSKEFTYGSSGEERGDTYHPGISRRPTQDLRDSPYTSANEESSRGYGRRNERYSSDEKKKLRRKSSHRGERPVLVDSRLESVPSSALDGHESKYYRHEGRERSQFNPITPISGDAGRAAMEDYFERAFKDNDSRRSQKNRVARPGGSALASPMTSPPRTPRSERQSKEYFDMTTTTQRPMQRSRPPSMDEGQIKELKMPNTLLSAATAGAALAARASGVATRSSGPSPEDGASSCTSRPASAPRSRRPSPVLEDFLERSKHVTHSPADLTQGSRGPLTPTHDSRPSLRSSITGPEGTFAPSHPQYPHPHRALSYSAMESHHPWNGSYPSSAVTPSNAVVLSAPGTMNHPPQPRSARSSLSPVEVSAIPSNSFGLPPCPRPQPVVGYRDWYTIKDISDMEVCPSCTSIVGNTRYRDLFIPSLPRPYNEPSVCAMSKAWNRIAFMQSLRQNRPDLSLLRAMTALPRDTRPCAGGKEDVRKWFHLVDPQTREPVPEFFACAACVRAVDHCFPNVCTIFDRPKNRLNQERSCGLHVASKHFHTIIDHLDQAQGRCKGRQWRPSDVDELIRHVRRLARHQTCPRDEMQASRAWHFMPDLPEFTICEECYDEVVRPVSDRSLARDISKTLKPVLLRRGSVGSAGTSCQLYSERMRKIFRDAISYRDFPMLRDAVKTRVSAQQRLSEMNKLYEQDVRCGIDRRQELGRNQDIWRTFE